MKIGENIDYFFNKLLPKKLIVVTIATVIVFLELEPPDEYWWILLAYFGVNIAGNITKNIVGNKEKK
jgi:hypothetical protein